MISPSNKGEIFGPLSLLFFSKIKEKGPIPMSAIVTVMLARSAYFFYQ